MAFSLKVNGTEISQYFAYRGLKWLENDVDGPNTGRALDGGMIRDYVATKDKLEITCRPLEDNELAILLPLVKRTKANKGEFTIEYTSPLGDTVTKTMYLSSVPASYLINRGDKSLWGGVALHFIEV